MTVFANGRVLLPEGIREGVCLRTHGGVIVEAGEGAGPAQEEVIDLGGRYLAPGFIDIHCHGGGGHDFMDNTLEAMRGALACHMRHGATTLVPTTVSGSVEELRALGSVMRAHRASGEASSLPFTPGLHLEGPYIAQAMRGAQDPQYIKTPAELPPEVVLEALGQPPLIWTVAPEIAGVSALCRQLAGSVYFSAGHSDAVYTDVEGAVADGFTMATHLYSAMSTIRRERGYRLPGLLEAALLMDELVVELIADGAHVPPELLRLVVKTKGVDGVVLITDAMRGADMPPGVYHLGSLAHGQPTLVDAEIARMPDGVTFAGSVATADRLIRTMVQKAGVPLADAVAMMTRNPARAIGLQRRKGALRPGMDADLVVFDEDIRIHLVMIGGKICYTRKDGTE